MEKEALLILVGGMTVSGIIIFCLLTLFKCIERRRRCGKGSYGLVILGIIWAIVAVKLFSNGCAALDNKAKSLSLDEQYEAAVQEELEDAEVKDS